MCSTCIADRATTRTLSSLGTLFLALIPTFSCPLCWYLLAAPLNLFGLRVEYINPVLIVIAALTLTLALLYSLFDRRDRLSYLLTGISSGFILAYRLALLPALAAWVLTALITGFLLFRSIQRFTDHAPTVRH